MSARFHRFCLLVSVTLTGMAVLVVEITATRMLAPHFGNTIFTISSVIGIVLAALGIGYYAGGILADRKPSESWFFSLIALSGLAVLLLQFLNLRVLPAVAGTLSLVHGPLLVSLVMFFFPAFFLAMLSPYAITLLHRRAGDGRVGNVSGLVFFWSTLGSIAGSLGTGFVLIPHWGIGNILAGVGVGLVLLGAAGLFVVRGVPRALPAAMLVAGVVSGTALPRLADPDPVGLVYTADGLYDRIMIRNVTIRGRPARLLWQDQNVNGGLFLDDGSLALDYTMYFDLYRLFTPELSSALAIGGGAYSVPRAILLGAPRAVVDVAEIDPTLHALALEYFGLVDDARLRNHVADGRRFLRDAPGSYDLIFLDAYRSFISVPPQMTTREFFALAKDRLRANGVLISNYYGSLRQGSDRVLYAAYKTMRAVFPQVYVFATADPSSERLQNFIFVGHKASPQTRRIDLAKAAEVGFAYPELRGVAAREWRPSQAQLAGVPVLTDDYAPVEHYAAGAIRQYDEASRKRR